MPIATIILIAVLALLIFALALFAFSSAYKQLKFLVNNGQKDEQVIKQVKKAEKKSGFVKALEVIVDVILIAIFLVVFTGSVFFQGKEQVVINNKVIMVVASDSMDGFYDSTWQEELTGLRANAANQQFAVGDIVIFEPIDASAELVEYDVYGYIKNGDTIIHRYIGSEDNNLIFRGDNAKKRDVYVDRSAVAYHYTETKIVYVGNFILFLKSTIGLYAIIAIAILFCLAEIYSKLVDKLYKSRYAEITAVKPIVEEKVPEVVQSDLPIVPVATAVNMPVIADVSAEVKTAETKKDLEHTVAIISKDNKKVVAESALVGPSGARPPKVLIPVTNGVCFYRRDGTPVVLNKKK